MNTPLPCRDCEATLKLAHDLTKILLREGDFTGAYERQLAQAIRERDEARAEVERLRRSLSSAERVSVVRQRDADLSFTLKWLRMQPCETSETLADDMPVPPLVTEGEP